MENLNESDSDRHYYYVKKVINIPNSNSISLNNKTLKPFSTKRPRGRRINQIERAELPRHGKDFCDNMRTKSYTWFFAYIKSIINGYLKLNNHKKYKNYTTMEFIKWKKPNINIKENKNFLDKPIKDLLFNNIDNVPWKKESEWQRPRDFLIKLFNEMKQSAYAQILGITLEDFYNELFLKNNNILGQHFDELIALSKDYSFQAKLNEEKNKNSKDKDYIEKLANTAMELIKFFKTGKERKKMNDRIK